MKKEKLRQEIRYYEGFKYIYIVLPLKFHRKKEQSVKVSVETKHDWSPDSPEVLKKF
jgi:hypothetical protein